MSSSDPQPSAAPHPPAQPTTQEIPVATPASAQPLPPHPGATPPAPVPSVRSTGPVDFVPGPPGPPPPPPAPVAEATSVWPESLETGPAASADPTPAPRDKKALLGVALVAAALVLLELGLALRFGGESFWSEIPLWSAFATVCTALGLAGFAALIPGGRRLGGETGWRVAAGGLVGLAVFWLLVVLPVVAGDRGFLLTAALGCLGAALWTGPARKV